jgi:type IV pilus assembly protein PilN
MARINLLPWRAERRKLRQKEFLTLLGLSAIAGVVLWFLINTYYNNQISGQNDRNAYLKDQITQVDKQIAEIDLLDKNKAKLLARKQVIEQLQANRSEMVHLFDALVRTIPDGVILTSIKQEGDKLTLEGRSQSNARVSTYMRTFEGSGGWMSKPDLSIIEAKAGDPSLPYVFTMTVMLTNPNAPKDENGDGVPDAAVANTPAGAAGTSAASPAALSPPSTVPATPVPATTTTPAAPASPAVTPAPAAAHPSGGAAP